VATFDAAPLVPSADLIIDNNVHGRTGSPADASWMVVSSWDCWSSSALLRQAGELGKRGGWTAMGLAGVCRILLRVCFCDFSGIALLASLTADTS
jgi:hypothetical protein